MNNKIVIYTAIAGQGRDALKDPEPIPGVDYICFTDQKLKSDVWNIIPFKFNDENLVLKSKHPKVLPHKYFSDFNVSIWVDGNIVPNKNIILASKIFLSKGNIVLHKHPRRNCLFDEAIRVHEVRKCDPHILFSQIDAYKLAGMPKKFGLWECGVIFRHHNEENIVNAMELWWNEIISHNQPRDQISFAYVVWKTGLKVHTINQNIRKASHVKYTRHVEQTYDMIEYRNVA